MDLLEAVSCIFLAVFKLVFIVVDFVFTFVGIKQLKGAPGKYILWVFIVIGCIYQLKKREDDYRDDAVLACVVTLNAYCVLRFVWKTYDEHVILSACKLSRLLAVYGKLRIFVYVLSVILAAVVVVNIADVSTTSVSRVFSEEVIGRLDNNILEIEEDRVKFEDVMVHPITRGEKYPLYLYKLYRYPMEDVQMDCKFKVWWLSGASPAVDQVAWRRNGAPLTLTDRHRHQVAFREIQHNETLLHSLAKDYGLSEYEVTATLTIYLLRSTEFGSYTCHNAKHMNISVCDFITNAEKLANKTRSSEPRKKKEQKANNKSGPTCNRQTAVDEKRLFKDEFIQKGEFRLIRIPRRQEIIRAPASSILRFSTNYWHLSWKDDVEIDYSVNQQSYHELCPDTFFHGCSKVLLLYWLFGHQTGGRFGIPPLHLFTIWGIPDYPAERYSLVHCLCENAYGYHNVKYLRRYYNITTRQHELIEILHPHVLVVLPREQHMLNLFVNRSQCSPVIERPVCETPPSLCKATWDFQTIQDLAEVTVKYFHWFEMAAIIVALFLVSFLFRKSNLFLGVLGRHIARLTLEGSMGFLSTAEIMGVHQQQQENDQTRNPGQQPESDVHYDIFLSYSESEADTKRVHEGVVPFLESHGLKVCARERDLSPNLPEIQSISRAIENSDRFIVFLSSAYFDDSFRKDFEAAMIIEALCSGSGGTAVVLLVRLDQCETPLWLSQFQVHDWTTACFTPHDHLLRLLKWMEPPARRGTLRSKTDLFLTALPLLVGGLYYTVCFLV